jgi:exodeoxyribonuclease VII large subunit
VSNKAFKTPTAVAEELVARFVQMRRQLDESANALKTVWAYRLQIARVYLERSVTGINQGTRKLLDVTASSLREQAQELSLRVKERLSTEQIHIEVSKEKLRSQPLAIIQKNTERLTAKKQNLESRTKFVLSCTANIFFGMKQRFDRGRFLRRVQSEHDRNAKFLQQFRNRSHAVLNVKTIQHDNLKDRLRIEKIRHLIFMERKSLHEKMATLKASDSQSALQRGFALVYRLDGKLIRSIHDVNEKEKIFTSVADGSIFSEVTAKEDNRE